MGALIFFIVLLMLGEMGYIGGYLVVKRRLQGYTKLADAPSTKEQ